MSGIFITRFPAEVRFNIYRRLLPEYMSLVVVHDHHEVAPAGAIFYTNQHNADPPSDADNFIRSNDPRLLNLAGSNVKSLSCIVANPFAFVDYHTIVLLCRTTAMEIWRELPKVTTLRFAAHRHATTYAVPDLRWGYLHLDVLARMKRFALHERLGQAYSCSDIVTGSSIFPGAVAIDCTFFVSSSGTDVPPAVRVRSTPYTSFDIAARILTPLQTAINERIPGLLEEWVREQVHLNMDQARLRRCFAENVVFGLPVLLELRQMRSWAKMEGRVRFVRPLEDEADGAMGTGAADDEGEGDESPTVAFDAIGTQVIRATAASAEVTMHNHSTVVRVDRSQEMWGSSQSNAIRRDIRVTMGLVVFDY